MKQKTLLEEWSTVNLNRIEWIINELIELIELIEYSRAESCFFVDKFSRFLNKQLISMTRWKIKVLRDFKQENRKFSLLFNKLVLEWAHPKILILYPIRACDSDVQLWKTKESIRKCKKLFSDVLLYFQVNDDECKGREISE